MLIQNNSSYIATKSVEADFLAMVKEISSILFTLGGMSATQASDQSAYPGIGTSGLQKTARRSSLLAKSQVGPANGV